MTERRAIGSGWMFFAAVALLIASGMNAMTGFAMLTKEELFDESAALYENLDALGWVFVLLALGLLVTSVLLFQSSPIGRVMGLVLATLNMLFWFSAVGTYPIWGATVLFVDMLIIYGLAAHPYDEGPR